MRHPARLPRQRAFTFPEVMAVLAITSILAVIAAPSFTRLIAGQRMRAASSDLMTTLARARSEAVKRNTDVTITPVTSTDWKDGWSIAHPTVDNTNLEVHAAINGATIDGPAEVVFQPNGRIRGSTAPAFDIQLTGTDERRCVSVDLSGRPVEKKTGC